MVVKAEHERVRSLLSDTITLLCRNGLTYKSHFNISAVIGITLDSDEVFLVDIRETVKSSDEGESLGVQSDEESTTQAKRARKRSRKKRSVDGNGENDVIEQSEEPKQKQSRTVEVLEGSCVTVIKDEPLESHGVIEVDGSQLAESQEAAKQIPCLTQQQHYPSSSVPPPPPTEGSSSWDVAAAAAAAAVAASETSQAWPPTHGTLPLSRKQLKQLTQPHATAVLLNDTDDHATTTTAVLPGQSDRKKIQAAYDSRRRRTFQESWRAEFPWVDYSNGYMFCAVCKDYESSGQFITGCNNFKKNSLRAHEKSSTHRMHVLKWSGHAQFTMPANQAADDFSFQLPSDAAEVLGASSSSEVLDFPAVTAPGLVNTSGIPSDDSLVFATGQAVQMGSQLQGQSDPVCQNVAKVSHPPIIKQEPDT